MLIYKTFLTPLLVLLATLAQRRWGDLVGGQLTALPLTSGPFVLIVTLDRGADAGRAAAEGILTGTPAVVVFCAGYLSLARRHSWRLCLPVAVAATAISSAVLGLLAPPTWISLALVAVVLTGVLAMTARPGPDDAMTPPAWELPAKLGTTAALVIGLSTVATSVDPRVAGVVATFPVLACVLVPFTHRGARGHAARMLRGLLAGLPSAVLFFCVLVVTLHRLPTTVSFLVATATAIGAQLVAATVGVRRRTG